MTPEESLLRLGNSTLEAVARVLQTFSPDGVETGAVSVVAHGASPLAAVTLPAVLASVSYVDGVSGGNVFVMTRAGGRRLAAAMMGQETDGIEDGELSELELSAVGEAMNQMMAAAAGATSSVLDEQIEIAPPDTRVVESEAELGAALEETPHATNAGLTVLGEPCRLVQLVPNAFVLRMTRALAELEGTAVDEGETAARPQLGVSTGDSIRHVPVRVSAELGRTRMAVGNAVRLWRGAVVELDPAADALLEVRVNGYRFALGRLLLLEDNEWGVRIEQILAAPTARETTLQEGVS